MFNNKEYMKEYRKRPENRERKRELSKNYYREMSPEKKEERSDILGTNKIKRWLHQRGFKTLQ